MADVKQAASEGTAQDAEENKTPDEEIAALRAMLVTALADADARSEQLAAAKEKAKALIRLQQERAAETREQLEKTAASQKETITELTERVSQLEEALRSKPTSAPNDLDSADSDDTAARSVALLRDCIFRLAAHRSAGDDNTSPANTTSSDATLTNDKASTSKTDTSQSDATTGSASPSAEISKITDECRKVESIVAALADDFLAAKTALRLAQEDGGSAARALEEARGEAKGLRSKLAVAEAAASDARAKASAAAKDSAKKSSAAESKEIVELREAKSTLNAKLSGMDALLIEKQTELGKVRDKARIYLKEITAEKRAVETRMKAEVANLKEDIRTLESKLANAESNSKVQDSEMDNCLALVSEKQRTIQMLNMSLSTERKAVSNSLEEFAGLKAEFAKYKERARVALEDRDSRLQKSDMAVAVATTELRAQVQALQTNLQEMQTELVEAQKESANARFNMERAVRAETALELQRNSASSESTLHSAKLKKLEQQVEEAHQLVAEAQRQAEDAESRVEALTARLQVANEKLGKAHERSLAQDIEAVREANELRDKIAALEASLKRSNQSASAAQRVAAVAARAMATSPAPDFAPNGPRLENTPRSSPSVSGQLMSPSLSDIHRSRLSIDDGLAQISSSSLAAVMSSHSLSMGLASPRDPTHSPGGRDTARSSDWDDTFRDQQVGVLTSQLSELSTLLDDAQDEAKARQQQTDVLKAEIRKLTADLEAAQKLHNEAPFHYLRSVVVRYLETTDNRLLPVLADVLAIPKDDIDRIRARSSRPPRGSNASGGAFSFLGRR